MIKTTCTMVKGTNTYWVTLWVVVWVARTNIRSWPCTCNARLELINDRLTPCLAFRIFIVRTKNQWSYFVLCTSTLLHFYTYISTFTRDLILSNYLIQFVWYVLVVLHSNSKLIFVLANSYSLISSNNAGPSYDVAHHHHHHHILCRLYWYLSPWFWYRDVRVGNICRTFGLHLISFPHLFILHCTILSTSFPCNKYHFIFLSSRNVLKHAEATSPICSRRTSRNEIWCFPKQNLQRFATFRISLFIFFNDRPIG